MKRADPYLNFNGNTEEAFNFYKSVFGGEFLAIQRFKDSPEGQNVPQDARDKIMHISLPLGKNNILMGTDAPESMGFKIVTGNNSYILLETESEDEAAGLYKGLSAGGKIEMELQKTFWGAYYGSFTDKFGIRWMINYAYPGK